MHSLGQTGWMAVEAVEFDNVFENVIDGGGLWGRNRRDCDKAIEQSHCLVPGWRISRLHCIRDVGQITLVFSDTSQCL